MGRENSEGFGDLLLLLLLLLLLGCYLLVVSTLAPF
jgi:hypothetical protein